MKYLLLDGFNLAFRAFYGMPELSRKDGFPTNALHGWMRTLWMLDDLEKPDRTLVFFDLGGAARQSALLADYKANRTDTPPALQQQFPYIKKLTLALGLGAIEAYGVEADDLLASWALRLGNDGHTVFIVSADKDLGQLVGGNVYQINPPPTANPKLGWRKLDAAAVEEKFGVPPRLIPDLLALTGDTSDNIPGIAGVGLKTAANWLRQYGGLEAIIANCGLLKPQRFQAAVHAQKEDLRRNLKMTMLDTSLAQGTLPEYTPDYPTVLALLEELEMPSTAREVEKRKRI